MLASLSADESAEFEFSCVAELSPPLTKAPVETGALALVPS